MGLSGRCNTTLKARSPEPIFGDGRSTSRCRGNNRHDRPRIVCPEDRVQQLYLVGAMGAASGMALGISLNSEKPIIVLDGDGAALMKLGTLATIGARRPGNLTHILLDNGVHDSTGGQATVSASVDFAALAQAAHYPMAYRCDSIFGFVKALSECTGQPGPHFVHVRSCAGSPPNLGRPTVEPSEIAERFRTFLGQPN